MVLYEYVTQDQLASFDKYKVTYGVVSMLAANERVRRDSDYSCQDQRGASLVVMRVERETKPYWICMAVQWILERTLKELGSAIEHQSVRS